MIDETQVAMNLYYCTEYGQAKERQTPSSWMNTHLFFILLLVTLTVYHPFYGIRGERHAL